MANENRQHYSYTRIVWQQFCRHPLGLLGLGVTLLYCLMAIYAPLLASSKPLIVQYDGNWYFPLFRYLFYKGFYTKYLDIFFNLLMFTIPLMIVFRKRKRWVLAIIIFQFVAFLSFIFGPIKAPDEDLALNLSRQQAIEKQAKRNQDPSQIPQPSPNLSWAFDLAHMNDYSKLKLLLNTQKLQEEHQKLIHLQKNYGQEIPTLWQINAVNAEARKASLEKQLGTQETTYWEAVDMLALMHLPLPIATSIRNAIANYQNVRASLNYQNDQEQWLKTEQAKLCCKVMPFISHYHWEDDAGGTQAFNQYVGWTDLTRVNRKDLTAALIFGARISLVVGIVSISLALLIGIPLGALAGYYGGTLDIFFSRILEVWESMPTFFMLLFIVAILQSKSIFIIITVIGLFGWTGFCRFARGEFFKQRHLSYVEACRSQGFSNAYIMFTHILPNAIPPILTLLPFAIMGAMASEAGLSFLGLGDEGSTSWGVLMDEGRNAFPGESYLLWPPALLLTGLLVAIALIGDALRDAIDPKLHVDVKNDDRALAP